MIDTILSTCAGLAVGTVGGAYLMREQAQTYKTRWQKATKLLEDRSLFPELPPVVDEEPKKISKKERKLIGKQNYVERIVTMTPEARAKEEASRMFNGQAPVDPLTNLPDDVYLKMLKKRRFNGYYED